MYCGVGRCSTVITGKLGASTTEVLKVFSARDGNAVFREYLVKWKDQEVVVKDPLVKTDFHDGDTILVLVIRNKYPSGKPGPDLLSFLVVQD